MQAGRQMLHYRLIQKIGEGGMGEVWKAEDTTLGREVALKVLPQALAGDPDRLARLEREAKLLASLNHPNIATLYGLHQDGDVRFLTMELVEGDDLSARLAGGAIPQDETYEIARQIAQGLEAAHAAGVIHRDLKPANVKVRPDGQVKVLDFGLARAFEPASGSDFGSPTQSPTLTSDGTLAGTILGTAAYMSPEQARGHAVDSRTDVWAFGVVLYEMITGAPAFKSDTISDTLASVLKLEPDYDALPAHIPNRVRRLVSRCLQKDRRHRLHHIADARIILDETLAGVPDEISPELDAFQKSRKKERIAWIAVVLLISLVAVSSGWLLRGDSPPPVHRKIILALDAEDPDDPQIKNASISPDGRRILYASGGKVFVRDLDDWDSHEIRPAEGARQLIWSPDGESIAFLKDDELWRVSADGSGGQVISEINGTPRGLCWDADGRILLVGRFSDVEAILEVAAKGGEPRQRFTWEKSDGHFHNIHALPEGRGLLFSIHSEGMMWMYVLGGNEPVPLLEFKSRWLPDPVYANSGHILYTRGGSNEGVWAQPFSLETLQVEGEPFLVAANGTSASVSVDGTLVYSMQDFGQVRRQLVLTDRKGEVLEIIGQPHHALGYPSLSPDGGMIVVEAQSDPEKKKDLWVVDRTRGTSTRLTFTEEPEEDPVWTPDGKRVVYRVVPEDGQGSILITEADGTGEPAELVEGGEFRLSPDGRYLVYALRVEEQDSDDIWYLELSGDREPKALIQGPADEDFGDVSPDGNYIVYESDESDQNEIYLKRFPSGDGKWQISVGGGDDPRWSSQGDEVFWMQDGDLMSAAIQTGAHVSIGTPRRLFSWDPDYMLAAGFDVADQGDRFVLIAQEQQYEQSLATRNTVMLVENWLEQ